MIDVMKKCGKDVKEFCKNFFRAPGEEEHYTPKAVEEPSRAANFTRFSDLLPYTAWDPESRLFVLEGDVPQKVDALGFCLEMTPQTGASQDMAELYTTLFTYLPADAGVQWTLLASPLIDDFVENFVDLTLDPENITAPDLKEKAHLYRKMTARLAEHFLKGARQPLLQNAPLLLRQFRIVMSITIPATSVEDKDQIAEIVSLRETCITTLKTYFQFEREMSPEDLINWCALILNPQETMRKGIAPHLNYDDGKEIKRQIIAPDTVMRPTDEGLVYGLPQHDNEIVTRCMSVRSYPKACTLHAMGALIGDYMQSAIGYSSPFMITTGIMTQDYDQTRNVTQMKSARATQKADSPMARFMPELRDIKHDWDVAQKSFDDGKGTVKLYHQIVLFAKPQDIARAEQSAQAVWRSKQFEIAPDTYMQVQALLGSLPMTLTPAMQRDIKLAQRLTTKTISNAVNMAPLLGEWQGCGKPVLPLWGRRGQAMAVDLFANTAGNYNGCVVGTSGSGKSVLLNMICMAYLRAGARVWTIDIGRSYENMCKMLGGQYLEFTGDADIRLNPFTTITDIDEDIEMLVPLFAQMISPSKPLDDYCLRQLTMHIQSVWLDYGPAATIDHVAYSLINNCEKGGPNPRANDEEWVAMIRGMSYEERQAYCDPRIRDLGVQLYPYTSDGPYGKYFAGESNINFNSNFIVLELEELSAKPDLQAVVMFLLMYKITQDIYLTRENNQRKLILIDEAWSLLGGGGSGNGSSGGGGAFIESGYRRARKYGAGFLTGTQGIGDYFKSDAAEAALNNSDWMFLLRQKPESIIALEKSGRMVMDENMRDLLLSVKKVSGAYSEVFVHGGQMGQGIGRLILDPFTLLVTSSEADDFTAVRKYRAMGLSIVDAVEAVLRDRGYPGYGKHLTFDKAA